MMVAEKCGQIAQGRCGSLGRKIGAVGKLWNPIHGAWGGVGSGNFPASLTLLPYPGVLDDTAAGAL